MSGLKNMKGLDSIKRIGVLGVGFNPNMENLDGLETLKYLTNAITIYNNDILKDVDALENLIEFKTDNNFKAIHFQHNPELESILGLRNIFGQLSAFTIENNPKLETCSLPIICTAIENNANGLVVDNKVGCENKEQILAQCLDPVTIKIFLDRNENSLDDIEPGVTIGQVLYNDIYSLLPNNEGIVKFDFSTVTNSGDSLRVGITPTVLIDSIDSYLIHGPPICDLPYNLHLIVKNNGTTTVNVTQKIIGLGTFSYASETPIFSDESTATFEINNLFPGQTRIIKTIFVSPNIIDLPLGALTFQTLATTAVNETGTQFLQDTTIYQHEFLCAYDPNDKRVTPAGVQDEHYTLFAEKELQYNIRFQNTGNYMARTVIIRDTLDQNLDLSTFNYVGASHPITQVKVERNYLEFVFENINLPDSLHNEAESHGFVSYTISPNENLAEFTKIENTAHIYFDSNPAIVTNTTFNTMVSIIPGLDAIDENTDNPALHLFPNPVHDLLHINRVNELYGSTYTISDTQGQRITSGQLNKSGSINVSDFPSGIYFIKAENYFI